MKRLSQEAEGHVSGGNDVSAWSGAVGQGSGRGVTHGEWGESAGPCFSRTDWRC